MFKAKHPHVELSEKQLKHVLVVMGILILLLSEPFLFSYTQSFDDYSITQQMSTNCELASSIRYVDVNISEAKQMIESNPNLVILDVRTQEEYDSGHIENAVLIPVDDLAGRIGELDKEKEILVYCKTGGRSVIASELLIANGFKAVYNMLGGIRAWMIVGYWIEIVHKGDLVIGETQTFVIENCTYLQTGSVTVESSATLVIRNAKLLINMTQEWERSVRIQNNAILTVERSEIVGSQYFPVYASGTSTVNVFNSRIPFCSVPCEDESKVHVVNSSIYYVPCYDQSEISVTNSTLHDMLVSDSSEVYVGSSEVEQIVPEWSNTSMSVTNLNEGYLEYWNNHINLTVFDNQNFNLTFRDSKIYKWSLRFADGNHVLIANSTLGFVLCSGKENSVEFQNVRITSLDLCDFQGTLSTEKVFVTEAVRMEGSEFLMLGNLSFSEETQIIVWTSSNVTRNYNIIARNASDVPMINVKLTVFDENNTVIWNGVTDSLGKTSFNLTFADGNYTDILRLEAVKENRSASTTIDFLSFTPIVLKMRYFADLNGDGTINIVDIFIVAKAFGTKEGNPNYNPIADLDGNKEINIVDLYKIAKDYGKTV